jgi:RimJ/RimL family protein N-acetyltransferase
MSRTPFNPGDRLPTLEAGRVRLRWLTEADIPALFGIFGDPEVTRFWGFAVLRNPTDAAALLQEIHRGFHAGSLFQWGVETAEGLLVGTCTLSQIDTANRRAELGFALGKTFWGQGYMSAALPALLQFAFNQLGLLRIFADVDPRNARSIHALERLGFRKEGVLRQHYWVQAEPQDAVVYGLLRSEWAPNTGSRSAERSPD